MLSICLNKAFFFQIPRRAWFPSCLWSRRRGWPAFRTASPSCCPARTSRSSTPRATPSPATAKILLNDLTLNFNSVQIVKLEIFVSFYWWYKMLKSNECPWLFPGLLLLLYNTYSLQLIYDDFLLFAFSSFYIKILRKKTFSKYDKTSAEMVDFYIFITNHHSGRKSWKLKHNLLSTCFIITEVFLLKNFCIENSKEKLASKIIPEILLFGVKLCRAMFRNSNQHKAQVYFIYSGFMIK